jgi:hypothetical protein
LAVDGAFSNYQALDDKYRFIVERNGSIDEIGREPFETGDGTSRIIAALDTNIRKKVWLGGKPSLRNFLYLQNTAFFPTLGDADATYEITPTFVMHDFLRASFEIPALAQSNSSSRDVPDTPMAGTNHVTEPTGTPGGPLGNPNIEGSSTQAGDTVGELQSNTVPLSGFDSSTGDDAQPRGSVAQRVESLRPELHQPW